jgi:hypothetical protein
VSPSHHFLRIPLARATLLLCVLLGLLGRLGAQTVAWSPAGGKLPAGIISELSLIFENCEPKGDPAPPKVPGLMLALRGSSQSVSIINFKRTATVTFSFAARLEKKQPADIPAFTVETDKGPLTVASVRFEPGDATIGQGNLSVEEIAQSRFLFPSETVWAGEVFSLSYRLDVLRRYYHNLGSNPDWDPAPLVTEEWGKGEMTEGRAKGEALLNILYRTRGYAREPGSFQFNQAQQVVNIRTGTSGGFGIFGAQPELQQLVVPSDQPRMTVKPLPLPAPASFAGAVGQFKLASKVVPQDAKAGEPITWTLELSGTGNWPAITTLPSRSVPKAFEIVQPQARRAIAEGKLFEGSLTEDLVMIPRNPGTYNIPALSISYFDPKAGIYRTLSSEPVKIKVSPADTGGIAGGASKLSTETGGTAKPSDADRGPAKPFPSTPQAPAPLPGDPLAPDHLASAPLGDGSVLTLALLPLACLPLLWLIFAGLRAWERDPNSPRREALARLRRLLAAKAAPSTPEAIRALLLGWQRETARATGFTGSAPAARNLPGNLPSGQSAALQRLWAEADQALYGNGASLPGDWLTRARASAASLVVPGFPASSVLRHLIPLLAVSAFLIQTASPAHAALPGAANPNDARAREAYQAGNYPEAARFWSAELASAPLSWPLRHNLGLAYLQHDQPGAAMAELASAFAQNPTDDEVRRNFRLACTQAGVSPEILGELSGEGPVPALARLAPLRCWQYALALSSLLVATGLVLWLARAYGRRLPLQVPLAWSLLVLGAVLALLSCTVLHRYGLVRDEAAALVWQNTTLRSIPTEADATQKTSALPTGTLLRVDRAFVGWRHITLSNGEGGWVRASDLVMLWH